MGREPRTGSIPVSGTKEHRHHAVLFYFYKKLRGITVMNPVCEKVVDVVLVGAGGYGNLYVDELFADAETGLCRFVGVVDPMIERAPGYERIKAAGIPIFHTMEQFYEENTADLCCIAVPTQYHTPYTVCALTHGSHVLCEKPLSGAWEDSVSLQALSEKTGRFIMSGFQWSHNDAILALKQDIMDGVYGAAVRLKTLVLWPRRRSYFCRGTMWAGKKFAGDGTPIFDSVASNAAAHYLHNMLFVLGSKQNEAAMPEKLDAELFRANPIENFDTALIRAYMPGGADVLFIASHATKECRNPRFEYQFEKGIVTFDQDHGCQIVGHLEDGREIVYGNPFDDQMKKIRIAIANAKETDPEKRFIPCGVRTAAPHVHVITAMKDAKIVTFTDPILTVDTSAGAEDPQMVAKGLTEALETCYAEGCMLSEADAVSPEFKEIVKDMNNLKI